MIRTHLLVAAGLLTFEAIVGDGMVGAMFGATIALVELASAIRKEERRRHFRTGVIYLFLSVATMGVIVLNWHVAQARATPVIAAIDRFYSDRGRYPSTLSELQPRYLTSIPRPGFTWLGRRYGYTSERPQLYFPVMFHGIAAYDFPTAQWRTNE